MLGFPFSHFPKAPARSLFQTPSVRKVQKTGQTRAVTREDVVLGPNSCPKSRTTFREFVLNIYLVAQIFRSATGQMPLVGAAYGGMGQERQ
jgi:hypothetical protein